MAGAGSIRAGRAYVELGVSDKLTAALNRAQRKLQAFGASARQVGANMIKLAAASSVPFVAAAKVFTSFDDQMRLVGAVTGATTKQFRALTDEAKRLGRTTSFTASAVAAGMVELGRAGFDPKQIQQMTAAMLDLARATGVEIAEAAQYAGSTIRQFNLTAADMGAVADVLATTANASSQTITDLGEAMKYVGPIASVAGASVTETAAAIGVLANAGIRGTQAGTMLARAYKNLSNESKRNDLMRKLGIQAVDAAGNLRPVTEILRDIAVQARSMGSGDRLAVFEELFGRGTAGAAKLAENFVQFDALLKKIEASGGSANRTAQAMDAGIGGAFRRMLSAVEAVGIELGNAIAPVLKEWADNLAGLARWIGMFVKKNAALFQSLIKVIAIVLGVGAGLVAIGITFSLLGVAIGGFVSAISVAVTIFGILKTVGIAAFAALKVAVIALASPLGLIIAAVGVFAGAWGVTSKYVSEVLDWLGDRFRRFGDVASKAWSGIVDAIAAGDLKLAAEVAWAGMKMAWLELTNSMQIAWLEFVTFFKKVGSTAWHALLIGGEYVVHGLTVAWIEFGAFFQRLWTRLTSMFTNMWDNAVNWVGKKILDIWGWFDSDLDVEGAQEQMDKDLLKGIEKRDAATADKLREIENKRDSERKAEAELHDATLLEIGKDANEAQDKLKQQYDKKRAAMEAERARLQKELDDAVERARKAREQSKEDMDKGADSPGSPVNTIQDMLDKLDDQLWRLGDGTAGVVDRIAGEVRGIFSGFAFQSLQGDSDNVQQKQLATQRQIASSNKQIAQNTASGGSTYGA